MKTIYTHGSAGHGTASLDGCLHLTSNKHEKKQALATWDAVDEHTLGSSQNGIALRATNAAAAGTATTELFFQVCFLGG